MWLYPSLSLSLSLFQCPFVRSFVRPRWFSLLHWAPPRLVVLILIARLDEEDEGERPTKTVGEGKRERRRRRGSIAKKYLFYAQIRRSLLRACMCGTGISSQRRNTYGIASTVHTKRENVFFVSLAVVVVLSFFFRPSFRRNNTLLSLTQSPSPSPPNALGKLFPPSPPLLLRSRQPIPKKEEEEEEIKFLGFP